MTEHDPNERKRLEHAIAERAAQIRRLEMQEWCPERARRTPDTTDTVVTKSSVPATQRTYDMSAEWQRYIDRVSKSWLEASMSAVTIKLKEMSAEAQAREKMRAKFEHELLKLRAELLQDRLDQERGVKRSPLRSYRRR